MAESMKKKQSNRSCDVLIIGGGSAGLRAAIEAHDVGAHVLIISKSGKGDPHTVLARGGINAALGTMDELVNWGARFHREKDGRLTQRFFGAHTYRRTVFYKDWTGKEIIRVLMEQVQQRKIEIIDNIYVTKLLKSVNVNGEGPAGEKEGEGEEEEEVKGAIGI